MLLLWFSRPRISLFSECCLST